VHRINGPSVYKDIVTDRLIMLGILPLVHDYALGLGC
jgi:hypothetical protein